MKLKKKLALSLLFAAFAFPAVAHEHEQEHQEANPPAQGPQVRAFREGTPNVIPPATFNPRTLYINFSHNWFTSSFPRGSSPSFYLSYAPIENLQVDTVFSLRGAPPVEFEAGVKYRIFDDLNGDDFLSLAPRLAYNTRGNIFGFDLTASKMFFDDIFQVGLGYTFLSNDVPDGVNGMAHGLGVNGMLRVWKSWHLFGDVVVPLGFSIGTNHPIWSAGIKKVLSGTPHILTLFVGNTQESTISGRTVPTGNLLRAGFYYSIGIRDITKLPEMIF